MMTQRPLSASIEAYVPFVPAFIETICASMKSYVQSKQDHHLGTVPVFGDPGLKGLISHLQRALVVTWQTLWEQGYCHDRRKMFGWWIIVSYHLNLFSICLHLKRWTVIVNEKLIDSGSLQVQISPLAPLEVKLLKMKFLALLIQSYFGNATTRFEMVAFVSISKMTKNL